ncbi:MAG: DNA-binding protein [Arcobacteraceae bacterium]|jgi:transcriptional regulator with XRE-family HTH domain|nr:DNA-binding protein [Arcobacteraceae bacterium]
MTQQQILEHIDNAFPTLKKSIGLNQSQTAQIIGVSAPTLERWREAGVGPEYIKSVDTLKKSRLIYPKAAIAEYILSTLVKTA